MHAGGGQADGHRDDEVLAGVERDGRLSGVPAEARGAARCRVEVSGCGWVWMGEVEAVKSGICFCACLPGELALRKIWAMSRFSPGLSSHEEASEITSKRSSRMATRKTRSGRECGLRSEMRPTETDGRCGWASPGAGGEGAGAGVTAPAAPLLPPWSAGAGAAAKAGEDDEKPFSLPRYGTAEIGFSW